MKVKNPRRFYKFSIVFIVVGLCFGSLVGHINTLIEEQNKKKQEDAMKTLSADIRKTLSAKKGCLAAFSQSLILKAKKELHKTFYIDGLSLLNGEVIRLGQWNSKYHLQLETLSIGDLKSLGQNKKGHEIYSASLVGDIQFSSSGIKRTEQLSELLVAVDKEEKLVQCSDQFSEDATAMMVSLCEASMQHYDGETGYCHSPRSMAGRPQRGLSSVE